MTRLFPLFLLMILPFSASAKEFQAGTDAYLRSLGYTDEQLSQTLNTEDREPFAIAEGEVYAADPIADVLSRTGTTSSILAPWGDIVSADLVRDTDAQNWILTVTTADELPDNPSDLVNLLFYVDTDGNRENNEVEGVRGETDAEFSLKHNTEEGWYMDFRWYNQETDFWAVDRSTATTFELTGNTLTLRIPESELSLAVTPRWRVGFAVGQGSATQIDVIPTVGFPPPKGETYPTGDFDLFPERPTQGLDFPSWILAGTAALIAYLAGGWAIKKHAQKRSSAS